MLVDRDSSTIVLHGAAAAVFMQSHGDAIAFFGEEFIDLTEVFLDHNEDNVFSTGGAAVGDSRDDLVRTCYGPFSPISDTGQPLGNCFQIGDGESFVDFDSSLTFQKKKLSSKP